MIKDNGKTLLPPIFPKYKTLGLEDFSTINTLTSGFLPYCDYNFSNLFCWSHPGFPTRYTTLNENLVIQFRDFTSDTIINGFLGRNNVRNSLLTLLENFTTIDLVPEETIDFEVLSSEFLFKINQDQMDYILKLEDNTQLKGPKYKNKRRELAKFEKQASNMKISHKILDIKIPDSKKQVIEFTKEWMADLPESKAANAFELEAIERYFSLKDLKGFIPYIVGFYNNNDMIAFTINTHINDYFAGGMFGKARKDIAGISTYSEIVTDQFLLDKGYKFINIEQDLGLGGLRLFKKLWRPHLQLNKLSISKAKK